MKFGKFPIRIQMFEQIFEEEKRFICTVYKVQVLKGPYHHTSFAWKPYQLIGLSENICTMLDFWSSKNNPWIFNESLKFLSNPLLTHTNHLSLWKMACADTFRLLVSTFRASYIVALLSEHSEMETFLRLCSFHIGWMCCSSWELFSLLARREICHCWYKEITELSAFPLHLEMHPPLWRLASRN